MKFLKATLDDGTEVVGEFHKLAHVQRYVGQVYAGLKPFNAWVTVGDRDPNGEPNLQRTRRMINGRRILSIEEVDEHGHPKPEMARGSLGRWTAPAEAEFPLIAGQSYLVHRDQGSLRRYVLAVVDPEQRHYLDADQHDDGDELEDDRASFEDLEDDDESDDDSADDGWR